jgi:tyrosyl-tRNA synthetase
MSTGTISFAFGEPLLTITNNGLKFHDAAVSDPKLTVELSALNSDGELKLSSGKKKHVLARRA